MTTEMATLLDEKREAILGGWFDSIIRTYPSGASEFLATQRDQFRNPVGHAISQSLGPIFDEIVSTMDVDTLRSSLDALIRIRTVQEFTASEAVVFVYALKSVIRGVIRESLGDDMYQRDFSADLADLESRIDRVALLSFDKYMECRDKLHEIRTNEIRNRSERLIDRVNMTPCGSECGGDTPR